MRYEVRYLDVWGNAVDGYEVNDMHRIGSVDLHEGIGDTDVLKALIEADHLSRYVLSEAEVEWEDDTLLTIVDPTDGRPLLQLMAEDA